jgi:hypothetical protein
MTVFYWTVIYSHRHGTDAWPVFAHQCKDPERGPTEEEVIAIIGEDLYEPDSEDEWIEIGGRQTIELPDHNELHFWRKTAAELYGLASESTIEEHLSELQQRRCTAALNDEVAEGIEDEPTPVPTHSLPPTETWYTWRILATVEGETTRRLLVPWSDPHKHEFAFDFIYKTPEEAREGLKTMGAEDDAEEEGWILCKKTLIPIERLQGEPTPRPLPQTMPSSEDIYRERAREFFRHELDENDWDIDDEPQVSESNDGAYVSIWRWFPAEDE